MTGEKEGSKNVLHKSAKFLVPGVALLALAGCSSISDEARDAYSDVITHDISGDELTTYLEGRFDGYDYVEIDSVTAPDVNLDSGDEVADFVQKIIEEVYPTLGTDSNYNPRPNEGARPVSERGVEAETFALAALPLATEEERMALLEEVRDIDTILNPEQPYLPSDQSVVDARLTQEYNELKAVAHDVMRDSINRDPGQRVVIFGFSPHEYNEEYDSAIANTAS